MFPKSQFLFHVPSMAQHLVAGWDRRLSLEGDQHTWCGLCSAWWVLLSHPQRIVPLLYFSITCGVGMWCEWSWRQPYHFTQLCAFGPHTISLGRNHIWRYCSPRDGVRGASLIPGQSGKSLANKTLNVWKIFDLLQPAKSISSKRFFWRISTWDSSILIGSFLSCVYSFRFATQREAKGIYQSPLSVVSPPLLVCNSHITYPPPSSHPSPDDQRHSGCCHTWYLSRMPWTQSVENFLSWGEIWDDRIDILFWRDIFFDGIYPVLSQNLFLWSFRLFSCQTCFEAIYTLSMWREKRTQFCSWRKKWQISCKSMGPLGPEI